MMHVYRSWLHEYRYVIFYMGLCGHILGVAVITVPSCISFAGYTIFTLVLGLLHKLLEFPVGSLGLLRDWCHVNDVRCS